MNRTLLIVGLVTSLFIYSYTKNRPLVEQSTTQTPSTASKAKKIVKTTVTTNEGVKLEITFNNANQTATFILNGKVIELKQDTIASGIQYRNVDYVYREHQGEIILTKDGKAVFTNKK